MKKLFSTLLGGAALTAVLVMSQHQTKAGTINASSIVLAQEDITQNKQEASYGYWVLINQGWVLVTVDSRGN